MNVFPIRSDVKLGSPLVAILDREQNNILMEQDKMMWEQNNILREQIMTPHNNATLPVICDDRHCTHMQKTLIYYHFNKRVYLGT